MPHLSPMNWIMMFSSMLLLTLMMNSILWWKPQSKFFMPTTKMIKLNQLWNW